MGAGLQLAGEAGRRVQAARGGVGGQGDAGVEGIAACGEGRHGEDAACCCLTKEGEAPMEMEGGATPWKGLLQRRCWRSSLASC